MRLVELKVSMFVEDNDGKTRKVDYEYMGGGVVYSLPSDTPVDVRKLCQAHLDGFLAQLKLDLEAES